MVLNSFYQLDTKYFNLSGKFEWLIHYLLLWMILCFRNPWNVNFVQIVTFFLILTFKITTTKFEMGLNTYYHVDTRHFHLSGKFEWLIHYLLLVLNDFVFFNPLRCQFCTNCDIFSDFNIKHNNERSLKSS